MKKDQGVVMTEVLISSTIILLVFLSVIGVFVTSKWLYAFGLAQSNLQKDAAMIAEDIIVRNTSREQDEVYGLRSAASFSLPYTDGTEIDFKDAAGNIRRYFCNDSKTVYYDSPTQTPHLASIYTVPAGGSVKLFFYPVWRDGTLDNETVGVYILITQNLLGKTASGSISTYVNVRNRQK